MLTRYTCVFAFGFVLAVGLLAATPAFPVCEPLYSGPVTITDFGNANDRPFGIAPGDFDEDGTLDLIVARYTGNIYFLKGNGDATFQPPVLFAWKQATFNAWSLAVADINQDGHLDLVWGANASSPSTGPVVNDGEIRYFQGNGDGTFVLNQYLVSGVVHNAGTLVVDVGTDAGSMAAGDVDGDTDLDFVVGDSDGTTTRVQLVRNRGGSFIPETIVSQPSGVTPGAPIYYPAISTQNSPWGLALSDADGDGDLDLWIGDRALFVYLYRNDGAGTFTLVAPNAGVPPTRTNAYLAHESYRAAVGYTPSLGSADIDRDGLADLFVGLQGGAQTPASGIAHDGEILLDRSSGATHTLFGVLADVGTVARGVVVTDVDRDGWPDVLVGVYEGQVKLLRGQAPDASACDDSEACTTDHCTGSACVHDPLLDSTPCSDSDPCTTNDACASGVCSGSAVICNDTNGCTSDACDPGTGACVFTPNNLPCSDGDPTTCADVCAGGSCTGSPVPQPQELGDSLWISGSPAEATLSWSDPIGPYNVYRGALASGSSWTYNQTCLATNLSESRLVDSTPPTTGGVLYYLISRVDQCRESPLGRSSENAPIPNLAPCSTP